MKVNQEELQEFLKNEKRRNLILPDKLYKYRNADEFGYRMIEQNEIYFSSLDNMNDPMEGRIPILFEEGTKKQMFKKNLEMFEQLGFPRTKKERKKKAKELADLTFKNRNNEKLARELREDHFQITNNKVGIFSTSSVNDSKLMWSHYSDGHRGFCISFNSKNLVKKLNELVFEGMLTLYDEVRYYEKIKGINPYKDSDEEMFIKKIFTKTSDWRYEKEFRFISYKYINKALSIGNRVVDSVVLGMNSNSEVEKRVKKILKSKPYRISLKKAEIDSNGESMSFTEIDY